MSSDALLFNCPAGPRRELADFFLFLAILPPTIAFSMLVIGGGALLSLSAYYSCLAGITLFSALSFYGFYRADHPHVPGS